VQERLSADGWLLAPKISADNVFSAAWAFILLSAKTFVDNVFNEKLSRRTAFGLRDPTRRRRGRSLFFGYQSE
jgi:hypothetical protein